jgi:hypothetical protein
MPDAQPHPWAVRCREGILALNRSFRRTLEAENKSPRTVEAYTDAVRFLALYCEAHGKPLLAASSSASTSRSSSPTSSLVGSRRPPTTATGVSTPSSSGR